MNQNVKQGLLMGLAGFACLSAGDVVLKSMAGEWPGIGVAALRYCIGAVGLAVLLFMKEGRSGFYMPMPKVQLLRGFSVAFATAAFISAIFLMPLAEATAIQFINPMITALISAWLLKEKAGKVTWIVTITAFCGVMIVLRPNILVLGWAAILPVLAAFGIALMMIGNRKVAGAGSALQMQFWIAFIASIFLVIGAFAGHVSGVEMLRLSIPDWSVILRCAIVAVTATVSHWLVYLGTTKASAAKIAPTVYIQLLIAMLFGALLFNEWPDILSLLGSGIIIGAGLFLWYHEGRKEVK